MWMADFLSRHIILLGNAICHSLEPSLFVLLLCKALTPLYWGHFSGLNLQGATLSDELISPRTKSRLAIKDVNYLRQVFLSYFT